MIFASLVLIVFALCLGAMGGGSMQAVPWLVLVLLIVWGVMGIAKLAKGIVHDTPEFAAPTAEQDRPVATLVPTPPAEPDIPRRSLNVATHFRPVTRAAIRNLVLAISAKIAAELAITLFGVLSVRPNPFTINPYPALPYVRLGLFVWPCVSLAPLLVLVYALLRYPGPRAFAYSLVIPSLQILAGVFGRSMSIFYLFRFSRVPYGSVAMLSFIPWLLNILILYLAFQAVRLSGIQPSPKRLIIASAVMLIYTTLLPVFAFSIAAAFR